MAINVEVKLKDDEPSEVLIRRFFKKCKKQDIIKEYLEKTSFFKTRTQKKRDKILKNKFYKKCAERGPSAKSAKRDRKNKKKNDKEKLD